MLARNPYNPDFAGRVAFAHSSPAPASATGDRLEFLGRNGSLRRPAGLHRESLGRRFGAGFDSCATLQVRVDIPPGETREVVIALGQGDDREHALALARRLGGSVAARRAPRNGKVKIGIDDLRGILGPRSHEAEVAL